MSLTAMYRANDDEPEAQEPPASLVALLVEQVLAGASAEQAHGFFFAAGRRLAAARPLPPDCDLAAMMLAMNRVWRGLGLGDVSLELRADGLDAEHRFGPPLADGPAARQATVALLEGCYDGWFSDIGASDRLRTRLLAQGEDTISVRYGL